MRRLILSVMVVAVVCATGCSGGNKTELNDRQMSEEEKTKMKAEDSQIEDEESQGKIKGGKKAK
jgi:hypothetical protein